MNKTQLKRYAKLLAKCGVNVKKGQDVIVSAGLDQPEFVEMVVEELYKAGAANVMVDWSYQPIGKLNVKYKSLENLSKVPAWEEEKLKYMAEKLPCRLFISSADPDGMSGMDIEKVTKSNIARMKITKPYRDAIDNKHQWCIAAVPGRGWAKKVFPELNVLQAVEKLWDTILYTARADGNDPVKAWARHNDDLGRKCDYLNSLNLVSLEYKSSNGTDFKVGLIKGCNFCGGGETTLDGTYFNPNMPTEEIFTSPKAGEAEGIVYSTKPLSYQGNLIENFSMRFENGRVVEVKAEKGQELLEKMVSMDENAGMLGEVALIPYNSPINNTGVLFYNTLFDENASCHLAVGRGFSNCLQNYENLSAEEVKAKGINDSAIHVDFMIGSEDMDIVGVTESGERIQIFKNGDWAIEF